MMPPFTPTWLLADDALLIFRTAEAILRVEAALPSFATSFNG